MQRFRVKDLLIATTLIAIGLAMLSFVPAVFRKHTDNMPTDVQGRYFVVAVVFIGLGLGAPFHRPFIGVVVCTVVVVIGFHIWLQRPGWPYTLLAMSAFIITWITWSKGHIARTLLIATMLVAVLLGMIVWLSRGG